jgi:hypothetical protein
LFNLKNFYFYFKSTSTKQAREAAKSHLWDKKVARLNQQRELKPIFGCIYDPTLDEKAKFEITNYFHQFKVNLNQKKNFFIFNEISFFCRKFLYQKKSYNV